MLRIEIDLNVRVRGTDTYAGFEDIVGGSPEDLEVGSDVEVFEAESGLIGSGRITEIDDERQLIYLAVDWAQMRPMVPAPVSQLVVVWAEGIQHSAPTPAVATMAAGRRTILLGATVSNTTEGLASPEELQAV